MTNPSCLKVVKDDITQLSCDAIVNPANNELRMGGGVAWVIRHKGGQSIEIEATGKAPIAIGSAIATKAGRLLCQYVIHTATMAMDFKTDANIIRKATLSALKVAEDLKIASIAFPAMGCGVGRFPLEQSAQIMKQASQEHLTNYPASSLQEIIFCVYDPKSYDVFKKIIQGE